MTTKPGQRPRHRSPTLRRGGYAADSALSAALLPINSEYRNTAMALGMLFVDFSPASDFALLSMIGL